ncbi:MAG: hypothetical protein ACREJ3_14195 [Polyangiaceae bacterium]
MSPRGTLRLALPSAERKAERDDSGGIRGGAAGGALLLPDTLRITCSNGHTNNANGNTFTGNTTVACPSFASTVTTAHVAPSRSDKTAHRDHRLRRMAIAI